MRQVGRQPEPQVGQLMAVKLSAVECEFGVQRPRRHAAKQGDLVHRERLLRLLGRPYRLQAGHLGALATHRRLVGQPAAKLRVEQLHRLPRRREFSAQELLLSLRGTH